MDNEIDMMRHLDMIELHSKAIKILYDGDLSLVQSASMIKEMFRQYELEHTDLDSCCETMAKSDLQELIEDDNRERARDMNKAMGN